MGVAVVLDWEISGGHRPPPQGLMAATAFLHFGGSGSGCQFRDLDAEFFGAFHEMLPGECAGPLSGELVVERHGVVIVQQDEVIANGQVEPGFDDQSVFDRAWNGTDVHDFIVANEVGGSDVCFHFSLV